MSCPITIPVAQTPVVTTPCPQGITISNRLDVYPGNDGGYVLIPGCEPTSTLTSVTLARFSTCCGATVPLADALAAIPGSSIIIRRNPGDRVTRRWFALPPLCTDCPCQEYTDWYQVLKDLACATVVEEPITECDTMSFGYCPAPDFASTPAPLADPYYPEGTFATGDQSGILVH